MMPTDVFTVDVEDYYQGESFSDLEASAMDARSLAGRVRILALSVLSPQGLYRRFSLLLVALLAPVAAAYLVPKRISGRVTFSKDASTTAALSSAMSSWNFSNFE